MIDVQQVSFAIGRSFLVKDVSLSVVPGQFVVIMGANGAGKSTLLKMMAGSLHPTEGEILFKGRKIAKYKTEALATERAVLSQHYHISFPLTAREIVMMGRYPYFTNQPHAVDEAIVNEQMQKMQVDHLAARDYNTLSGGEAQKVQMARVLAQIGDTSETQQKLLLLDEPVSHLDIKYQHQLLDEAKNLCKNHVAVIAVLHDVNLALKYADIIVFMKAGHLVHSLFKNENITSALLKEVFDVDANIFDIPGQSSKFVSY
jgi:iron complex transport system ATP-binding protein